MDSSVPEIEHGPLSDNSTEKSQDGDRTSDIAKDFGSEISFSGLPSEYLKPAFPTSTRIHDSQEFQELTLDDSVTSDETEGKPRRADLKLDLRGLENEEREDRSGIVFSPGGSEAYVFTDANMRPRHRNAKTTPREIHEPIFVENSVHLPPIETKKSGSKSKKQASDSLRQRFENIRLTLDHDAVESSTAESSPRNTESRRRLPQVPFGDQEPAPPIHQLTRKDLEGLQSPTKTRPISPSSASVVSAASSTASGMLSGRKNLEWDSGADLGYLGDSQQQVDAVASLSTLEKLAIGTYSNFLTDKPDQKASSKVMKSTPLSKAKHSNEDEMRQLRWQKYADSLLRHKELRAFAHSASGVPNISSKPKARSKSKESGRRSDSSPTVSPARSRGAARSRQSRKSFGSPVKSTSLTDLNAQDISMSLAIRHFRSNSDVSQHYLQSLRQHLASSEPSSCSSTTTVVPLSVDRPDPNLLQPITTDPESIPAHLQNLMHPSKPSSKLDHSIRHIQGSQISLSSRRSGSRSFETVINMGQPRGKWRTKDNLNSDSVEDTDEESPKGNRSAYFEPVNQAPRSGGDRREAWTGSLDQGNVMSRNSSIATTSDEDRPDMEQRIKNKGINTASSTLESAQLDRAKSFEYFPGETFPLQENSSSYEYLPGHLIQDRPSTVVSNRHNEHEQEGVISGVSTLSNTAESSTSGDDLALNPMLLDSELRFITSELDQRAKQLLQEHIHKTKRYYKKMRKHIAYVAAPSVTADESRKKQEILDNLLSILGDDGHRQPEASLSGTREVDEKENQNSIVDPVTIDEEEDTTAKITSIQATATTDGRANAIIHKKRIEQMRILRKEIKKLEKLEYAHLGQVLKSGMLDTSSMSDTDQSTSASLPPQCEGGKVKKRSENSQSKSLVLKISEKSQNGSGLKSGRPRPSSSGINRSKEFGQTYPTPRDINLRTNSASKAVQTGPSQVTQVGAAKKKVIARPKPVKKPVAYYLPVSNESIIVAGKRIPRQPVDDPTKENRNLLANFIASVQTESVQLTGSQSQRTEGGDRSSEPDQTSTNSARTKVLTLKDALSAKKPGFVQRAEQRRMALNRIKEQRLEQAEKKREWLEKYAAMPVKLRDVVRPNFPEVRVQRLFSYREMVNQTRRKYMQLPEVKYKAHEHKRQSSFRTNRIMKDVYKRRLQEHVLRGYVSLNHHRQIIQL